jgi:pimeloyl-ACP methyl ester carboxylesterase
MTEGTTTIRAAAGHRRLDRRAVLGGAAGAAAAGLASHMGAPIPAAAQDASPAAGEGGKATFVLVHGAYAGAWIWRGVIPLLRAAGHEVYATTATGMGDRVHLADPAINLDVYVTDVVNVLAYEDLHDVILVGHSFGGFIISGVAEQVPERLARLVYLDAIVPEDGQSNYSFWGYNDEGIGLEYREGVAAGWPGFEVVYPGVEEFLRGMTKDPADADWLISKFTPQPLAASSQPIQLGNPKAAELPRSYIFCTEEKGTAEEDPLTRIAERLRSDPAWSFQEIAANHMVLVNDPQATSEALLSLV